MKHTQSSLILSSLAAFIALSLSSNSYAVDAEAAQSLAKKNTCFRCHGIDKDKDGPAWKKIAAKYKAMPDAEAKLIHHLTAGDKVKFPDGHEEGHKVLESDSQADTKNLVDWILSL